MTAFGQRDLALEELRVGEQGQPYMLNSTPVNVLPVRSWMIPAISWTIPPDMSATAKIIGVTVMLTQPTLIALSMPVGTAKAASASGAELPHVAAAAEGVATSGSGAVPGGGCGPAGLMADTDPSNVVDIGSSGGLGLFCANPSSAPPVVQGHHDLPQAVRGPGLLRPSSPRGAAAGAVGSSDGRLPVRQRELAARSCRRKPVITGPIW